MSGINPTEINTVPEAGNRVRFRWTHIILPLVLLAAALILAAVFYVKISPEVAYHFSGGTPDRWFSRAAFMTWMLAPQVLFTLLAFLTVRVVLSGARYWPAESTPLQRLLPVMGNMMALPQLVLLAAMLQFILYNAYNIKPAPLWIIALVILLAGLLGLVVFFVRTIRQVRRQQRKNTGSDTNAR